MIDQIRHYSIRGAEQFVFHDSLINGDLKALELLCDAIIENFPNMLLRILVNFLYVWLLLIIMVMVRGLPKLFKIYKIKKAGLLEIDKMTGHDFEVFLEHLFRARGYKVSRVGRMADYGADLVIEKEGIKTVVQAKRWNNPVNVKAIQEIHTAMAHYSATKAVVVTNNHFTSNAVILAKDNHVELIDRQKLAMLIIQKP